MAEFLGDITFMLKFLVLGFGFVLLHLNTKEPSKYLKWGGRIMVSGALFGLLCTGYFYMKYFTAGEFEHAWPQPLGSPHVTHHNHHHSN